MFKSLQACGNTHARVDLYHLYIYGPGADVFTHNTFVLSHYLQTDSEVRMLDRIITLGQRFYIKSVPSEKYFRVVWMHICRAWRQFPAGTFSRK